MHQQTSLFLECATATYGDSAGTAPAAPALPWWKRTSDLCILFLCLPGLLLVSAAIALIIKIGSPGPLLFRQRRVGLRGREFVCFKFRTMAVNAETNSHRQHAQDLIKSKTPMIKLDAHKDPRLIPFGSMLRACGLDELPQLLNVLRGEMSIVGPRPCIPYECEAYDSWHWARFDAVPGLTGLWQVSGKNRTTFDQMVKLDIEYTQRLSFWLDAKIILKTVPALWRQCCDVAPRDASETRPAGDGCA
jgi:lipopolysaccharide/colanic/teichoic acid biosynthesis glycosyltransferase